MILLFFVLLLFPPFSPLAIQFFSIYLTKKIIHAGTKLNTFQYIFKKFDPSFLNSTLYIYIKYEM